MRLDQLTLTNFRGFESLDITFDPHVTVLLGGNMSGKTAVLEGAAIAVGDFFVGASHALLELIESSRVLELGDVRKVLRVVGGVPDLQPQSPVRVDARGTDAGTSHGWSVALADDSFGAFRSHAHSLARQVQLGGEQELPVLAYYGARRLGDVRTTGEGLNGVGSRFDGYARALSVSATYRHVADWMKKQTLVQLQRGSGFVQPQLAVVIAAVKACLGVTRLWYDVEYDELRLERSAGDLQAFGMLSDGYRNMVAMVADIAWRASVLNPQFGAEAHLQTEGVVLIDEVDLHLHPEWQRRVMGDLQRTFPKLQFIVTTHSPQVVASVSRSQVRLLDNNKLVSSDLFVEGRDSSELLEDVFGVPRRPEAAKRQLNDLYRLLEDEAYDEARAALAVLEGSLGPDDADVIRARHVLDTEAIVDEPPSAASR